MSNQTKYPRKMLQRVSDRKKRKLAIDDSDNVSLDIEVDEFITPNSKVQVVEDSQSPLKGYRDLFGELIPQNINVCKPVTESICIKKKPVTINKKRQCKKSTTKKPRMFIPTPGIMKIMKDTHRELYSLMGLSKSSSDVSVVSNDNLNVSGVQQLLEEQNEPETNSINYENSTNCHPVFEGVTAFVDYKIDHDRNALGIKQALIEMGAKVEETFNLKVTHVVFRDGYRRTYNKAIEHNIPLVSVKWMVDSKLANKMLDPMNYPPVDVEKYTKKRKVNLNCRKYNKHKRFINQCDIEHDQKFKSKCDELMKRLKNFSVDLSIENKKDYYINKTQDIRKTMEKTSDSNIPVKKVDIVGIISDELCKVLNTDDSPIPDDKIDNIYLPMSIKLLKKFMTPNEKETRTPEELNNDLVQIENRLNLNSQAKRRLRKLLFPSNKELFNISNISDFPSPSPLKSRISAPARLTTTKKQKKVLDKENVSQNKNNLISKKKTPQKKNILQWEIPSDLRPKRVKKNDDCKEKCLKITQTQNTITSMLSRNSTMIFETPKDSLASPLILQTIACTGMTKSEIDIIKLSVQNLGTFTFSAKVEPSTTFLVTKLHPKRTLNMVFGMAYGCYIISEDWVYESYENGSWLSHQKYLISDLSEPVKEFQKRRHTFGPSLKFHIFDNAGSIYISDSCAPSAKQLKQLVRACGGCCINTATMANTVVGRTPEILNYVNEKWILDCITHGKLLSICQYTLVNNVS